MNASYNPWMVALSYLIAAVASYTTLDLAKRVRATDRAVARGWWLAGSLTMGTGIWAMHFVGMLAFTLPIPVGYAYGATWLSWCAAVGVSAVALGLAAGEHLRGPRLLGGSLTMGAGICAMHYTGMLALSMAPGIRWSVPLVAVSALVAVGASAASLLIFFGLQRLTGLRGQLMQIGAALVMACGIAGMHYTGMAAAGFPADSVCLSVDALHGSGLHALIASSTLVLLTLTLFTSALDRRMAAHQARLEREVAARTADLVRARDVAEAANRAKTAFLAAMSHELRTPLTSIRGFSELMEHRAPDATTRAQAGLIRKGAEHLNALLTEILDFSKIEAGAMTLHTEPVDLAALVQGTVDFFALAAQEKGLALEAHIAADCAEPLRLDSLRLKQILNNLLSNALKFTPSGAVRVGVERDGATLLIHVDDTGTGIAAKLQELIFETFRQADDRVSHEHGGTGLGLALSRGLAQLMGGSLVVQSRVGVGSRFTLSLPITSVAVAPAATPDEASDVTTLTPAR
ncbi:MAG: MHYT domain-containing protein [Leptothrix sp. (in: b-proteobacteria)]